MRKYMYVDSAPLEYIAQQLEAMAASQAVCCVGLA
jgi:hypothetical protein